MGTNIPVGLNGVYSLSLSRVQRLVRLVCDEMFSQLLEIPHVGYNARNNTACELPFFPFPSQDSEL